jgi:hypothetical protein
MMQTIPLAGSHQLITQASQAYVKWLTDAVQTNGPLKALSPTKKTLLSSNKKHQQSRLEFLFSISPILKRLVTHNKIHRS